MSNAKKINKEELREVSFKISDGGISAEELRDRRRKLQLSILLTEHAAGMAKIVFNTIDGYREVKAAVWGATEKYILLTGGSFIPVEAVSSVSLEQKP
jgi:hypothetical protein